MSTITLPNIRVSSDLTVSVRLKDNGVAIDWSTLNNVKASIYSDAQRALAGRCDVSVDAEDPTVLVCQYAANKPQYVGVCRIVVSAKYMGETKTYDKPAFNFVRWTADQDGEQITIDDPDVDVEIDVADVSSSLLDEAIRAAFTAAEEAVDAKGQVLETEAEVEAAEALRVSAEESRVEAEEGRAEAEAARVDEEAVRVSAEDARVVAENARAAAEDLREGAEDDRAAAETARETAEAARVAAEALRVTAEGSRETAEAAREAQASADHTVAAGDHTQAAADHTQAAADHTTAASDHTQAGADHTLAAADHVTAGEDHAQAQDDHEVMAGYDTRLGNVEGEVSQLEAKVTGLDADVNGGDVRVNVPASTTTGYMYTVSNSVLSITANANSKYTPFGDNQASPVGIDISAYVGMVIDVVVSGTPGGSSTRATAITDAQNVVKASVQERYYTLGEDGYYHFSVIIPSGAKYLYWSMNGGVLESIIVSETRTGLMERVNAIESSVIPALSTIEECNGAISLPIALRNCNLFVALNRSGQYVGDYEITTHFIRVVSGGTINFSYSPITIDNVPTTPKIRVAYYADKYMSAFVSMGQSAYGNPASLVVPDGVKYMKVSIDVGNYYTREYYQDGDVTISFDADYPYDFKHIFASSKDGAGAEWSEIRRGDLRRGNFNNSGTLVKNSSRSTTRQMLVIRERAKELFMIRPDETKIYLYQANWYNKDLSYIGQTPLDNYESIEIPDEARFAYITLQEYGNTAYYGNNIPELISFFFNLSPRGLDSDGEKIIEQNNEVETISKLVNIKQPAKFNGNPQAVPLSILFFSDIHADAQNLQRLLHFAEYYNNQTTPSLYIDAILSGGDNVASYQSEGAFDFWPSIPNAGNILQTIGNHDAMANAALTIFADKKDVYDIEFAPYINGWGVTQPEDAAANGLMYYYKDFSTQKIRLIVLDCMFWDAEELSWLESILEDALQNNFSVIGCTHYPIGNTDTIECNFNSLDYNPTGGARLSAPISAVDNFINGGGEFICWLSGHTHSDGFGVVDGHNKQLNLIIDTAGSGSLAQDSAARVGTRTQDCFNILGIDTYSKLIKVVRIGRDYDRHLRHIGEMCVDYENGVVLYTR